ncbi:MAG TPA: YbhB/YbcL family Raf kinase inhibitor-like protein [Candidatus Saccharimonadales bacterium]|nr:YbhB/YbcL family Raf kinase inhibitor-like protein [Candidatus Saccharimonadales bacterium]
MNIASTGIDAKGSVLTDYTADGRNVNPPVTLSEVPDGTQSLMLIMDDKDAPNGRFVHWLVYDLPASTLQILEDQTPAAAKCAINDFGKPGYGGPQPPSGTHHYRLRVVALDTMLGLSDNAPHQQVEQAAEGHIIESAEIVGTYSAA